MKTQHNRAPNRATESDSTAGYSEAANSAFGHLRPDEGNRTLTHVTITTGHTRASPRHEVHAEVIAVLEKWLMSAKPTKFPSLSDEVLAAPVPSCDGFWGIISRQKSCLLVTLLHEKTGPCVTFGVAPSRSEGTTLWTSLGSAEPQPAGPWCGVRLEPSIVDLMIVNPEDISWLGDFERSVAWAWLALLEREDAGDATPAEEETVSSLPISEGVLFYYDQAGPSLRVFLPDPTKNEILSIRSGACQFKLVTSSSVIFILAKFGDMNWMDAPYSIHLVPPEKRKLCAEFFEGNRYLLAVTLFDSTRNVQCGSRLVSWNPTFSALFHRSVRIQFESEFSRLEYDENIRKTYLSTTTSKMASQALASTKGGD